MKGGYLLLRVIGFISSDATLMLRNFGGDSSNSKSQQDDESRLIGSETAMRTGGFGRPARLQGERIQGRSL
jgi:hypothetical protein